MSGSELQHLSWWAVLWVEEEAHHRPPVMPSSEAKPPTARSPAAELYECRPRLLELVIVGGSDVEAHCLELQVLLQSSAV